MQATSTERFSPLLLSSLVHALLRLQPRLGQEICRAENLSPHSLRQAVEGHSQLAATSLPERLPEMLPIADYNEVVFLAGRNALTEQLEQLGIRPRRSGNYLLYHMALKRLLPPFAGQGGFNVERRGSLQLVSLRESVFTRRVQHALPLCAFYSGWLQELASVMSPDSCEAAELSCRGTDPLAPCCQFSVALRSAPARRTALRL